MVEGSIPVIKTEVGEISERRGIGRGGVTWKSSAIALDESERRGWSEGEDGSTTWKWSLTISITSSSSTKSSMLFHSPGSGWACDSGRRRREMWTMKKVV